MRFTIEEFVRLRPFVYRVSSRQNLETLRAHRRLWTAANLIGAAGRLELLSVRRADDVVLSVAERFPRAASEVVELAFRSDVALPATTLMRTPGGWSSLFDEDGDESSPQRGY